MSADDVLFAIAAKALEDPDGFGPDDVQEILELSGMGRVWEEAVAYLEDEIASEDVGDDPEPEDESTSVKG